jgi:hypothetical protein
MSFRPFVLAILLILKVICPFAQTTIPEGTVSGTWDLDHSPYHINGNISIPDDSTLQIQPGVVVEFQGHYSLTVLGRLLAIGSEQDSIRFTINDTTGFSNPSSEAGGWYGIRFLDTPVDNDSSKIVYCVLEYGKAYGDVWHLNAGGAICILQFNKVLISNCLIKNNMAISPTDNPSIGGGVYLFSSDVILKENTIVNNRAEYGGAVFMDDSDPRFENNIIERNDAESGAGIGMGGECNPSFTGDQILYNTAVNQGGGMHFHEPSLVHCDQVIFTGNSATWGGGIGNGGGELQASNCHFSDNHAMLWGGAVAGDYATLHISSSDFVENSSDWGSGALHMDHATADIQHSTFEENSAVLGAGMHALYSQVNTVHNSFINNYSETGGGLHLEDCDCTVDRCRLEGNQALNGTGGAIDYSADSCIFGRDYELIIKGSIITENTASVNSGAVRIEQTHTDSSMVSLLVDSCQFIRNGSDIYGSLRIGNRIEGFQLSNSIFDGNTSKRWVAGPGIITESKGTVFNCVIFANYANYSDTTKSAQGVSLGAGAEVDFINCTVADTSSAGGVGISTRRGGIASISNSIIWGCGYRPISIITQADQGCIVDINFCMVENGQDSIYVSDTLSKLNWGTGNLALDPLFVDLPGADLHLQDASPCIGSGSNGFMLDEKEILAPERDLEGTPRPSPQGTEPDMGAYENALGSPVGARHDAKRPCEQNSTCWIYPNPLHGLSNFFYSVSYSSHVHLAIYSLQGQMVEEVVNKFQTAGHYQVQWDGSRHATGTYIYKLVTGKGKPQSGKLLIIR